MYYQSSMQNIFVVDPNIVYPSLSENIFNKLQLFVTFD